MHSSLSLSFLRSRSGPLAEGWLAVSCHPGRIDLAHLRRSPGRTPEVTLLESYQTEGDLGEALLRLRKEKRLQSYRCVALLAPGDYQVQQVEAPAVPVAEMREALRWKVKDMIDYPVEEATLDMLEIPGQPGSGRPQQVMAVMASNGVLSPLIAAFHHAGLALEAIDIPDLGQRNISTLVEREGRALAMLAFDEDGGLLTVSFHGELYVARRIDITRQALDGASDERREQLFERVVLEVQRTLDTFDRQYSYIPMGHLALVGVPAGDALREALTPNVYIPVEALDLASILDFPAIPELRNPERQAQCLKLLGAALRQ